LPDELLAAGIVQREAGQSVASAEDQMKCRVCGGLLEPRVTDLPFKIGDSAIVILRGLPVLE